MLNSSELVKKKRELENLSKKIIAAKAQKAELRRQNKKLIDQYDEVLALIAQLEKEMSALHLSSTK